MSKAVLAMDMPESCAKCCFCRGLNVCKLKKYLQRGGITTIFTVDKQITDGRKPDWCPLRPMKEKLIPDPEEKGKGWVDGWNACIDAIGGNDKC